MITEDMLPAMQGVFPANLATCSVTGVPNVTFVSQVFYVDELHVALSFQFFNKTIKNIRENPEAVIGLFDPRDFGYYQIQIRFDHSETEGDLFDQMDMQLEAIASMSGMQDIFKLKAADIYKVLRVSKVW
jgi:hypothetical protein